MKSLRPIVGTAVLAALAAGLWLAWLATRPPQAENRSVAGTTEKPGRRAPAPRMVRQEIPATQDATATMPVSPSRTAAHAASSGTEGTPTTAAPPPAKTAGHPGGPATALTREELQARAARIEQESNHELRRLVPLLNLSEAQQEQVFNALAVNSPLWVPGMATAAPGGDATPVEGAAAVGDNARTADTTAATVPSLPGPATQPGSVGESTGSDTPVDPLASILPFLTPEQQEALLADEMDKVAWWEEIIPQLLPDDAVPGIDGNTDTKAYTGSDTLD